MADYGSFDRLYDSSSSKKNPSFFSFETLHVFLLIGLIIVFMGFVAAVYIVPNHHLETTKSPPTPNFCIKLKTTTSDSNPLELLQEKENGVIWAPNFCIVSNALELSDEEDNGDTKPPIFNIKSMKVSIPFLSKEADQVWNIKMSIENPNLGMNISYDPGVVYVYHGTRELWTTNMKAFHQASWGHRLTRWRFVSSKSLPYSSAASSIRDDVARNSSVVFRVLVQTMIKVYPSSSLEKHYLLFVDCDGLKVDFPSGTMAGGGRSCQVQLKELTRRPSSHHHLTLSMAI